MGASIRFEHAGEIERREMTRQSIADRVTMVERWQHLTNAQSETWEHRSVEAGNLLADCARVADIGCGRMLLERNLPPGLGYVPVDVVARDERTIVCDLNREPLVPLTDIDSVAMLGLLEYLFDGPALVKQLPDQCNVAVISYCVAELSPSCTERHANGWLNAYPLAEFERMFTDRGWSVATRAQIDTIQVLWKFERRVLQ